jgi:tetratricopeptide (TPR) repeat protein
VKSADETRTQNAGPALAAPAWKTWGAVGLLVVVVSLAYANSFHGPFIFDDVPSIVENQSIRHLGSARVLAAPPEALTTTGRPVVNLSLAINFAVGGLAVEGYHVVNLALHILASLVLFALVRRTLLLPTLSARFGVAATELALSVALLWAIHPLQTESVTYVVQRAEVIAGLFYLLTLYCFLRGATAARGRAWYAAMVGACVLGMASKEVMVSVPLIAVLYDRTFIADSFKDSLRRRWRLWLLLAATWLLLAVVYHMSRNRGGSAGFGLGITVWEYARTQFGCIIHYLRLAFWPSPLVLDYGCPIARKAAEIVPYAIAVSALVAATAAGLAWRPKWGFLGAWFLAILAPTSSIVPLPGQTEAERRMYLPLAAVVALVVFSVHRAIGRLGMRPRRAMATLVPAVAAALGWGTYQRNKDYQSELAIWEGAVQNGPLNDRAYLSRGSARWTNGQLEPALKDYDQCIALNSRNAKCYIGRGNVYSDQGRYDEALKDFDHALRLKPDLADGYNGRGSSLAYRGQLDAAIREFNRAIELDSEFAQAYYNRANAYDSKGDLDAAIDSYDHVIQLRADHAKAYNSRGSVHDKRGETDAAILDYDRAIELRPDFAEAYSNRCSARDLRGQRDTAVQDCDKAIELRPDFAEAYSNRGNTLQGKRQYEAALKDYDKAIELKPNFAAAYQNRAMARLRTQAFAKAWDDVRRIRALGGTPIPGFVEELTRKSGRSE